jgi:hypothetical protein
MRLVAALLSIVASAMAAEGVRAAIASGRLSTANASSSDIKRA